ncbi:MAG: hypothetical protein QOE69_1792 [Thermoleophilaceae bacterium]|nr:hypothetical protein [Thermoleophilaceae bacterium]
MIGDRVTIDGLVVDDECAVRLVRTREEQGDDPVKTVRDAVEIGARVLDREQAGANAEFVKTEFEKAATDLNSQFTNRAREVAEYFNERVEQVFGPENGQLSRELEKLFSDGSTASVQNRVRELVQEAMTRSREDLMKQFSSADGSNPLADFKAGTIRVLKAAEERQHETQQQMLRQMAELEKQLQALRLEKEKLEEVDAERERGSAKGRTFEEAVADAVDAIALTQGDVAEAVGDFKEATGKVGDVVVAIDACNGPARGRIVFEAKDRQRLSGVKAMKELDDAIAERSADFAVMVVPSDDKVPAKMEPLREYNGDKLLVTFDPATPLALELAYRLARARALMKRSGSEGIDGAAVSAAAERALAALEEERKVKQQLTGAKTSIDNAYGLVAEMSARVRGLMQEIDALVRPAADDAPAPPDDQLEL